MRRPERRVDGQLRGSIGFHVVDPRGRRIGRIDEVIVGRDGMPLDAIVVRTGLFGRRISLLQPESVAEVAPAIGVVVARS